MQTCTPHIVITQQQQQQQMSTCSQKNTTETMQPNKIYNYNHTELNKQINKKAPIGGSSDGLGIGGDGGGREDAARSAGGGPAEAQRGDLWRLECEGRLERHFFRRRRTAAVGR